jgi:Primase X
LLHTPIADHRKFVSHWILSRYLINVKHINPDQAYAIMKDWSLRCNEIMPLSPSVREYDNKIRNDIKEAIKSGKAPIGDKLLKDMNNELYKMVFSK